MPGERRGRVTCRRMEGWLATMRDTLVKGSACRSPTQRSATAGVSRRMAASRAGFSDATCEPKQAHICLKHKSHDAIRKMAASRAGFSDATCEPNEATYWMAASRAGFGDATCKPEARRPHISRAYFHMTKRRTQQPQHADTQLNNPASAGVVGGSGSVRGSS